VVNLKFRQVYSEKRIWSQTVHLQILYTFAYTSTGRSTRPRIIQYQLHFLCTSGRAHRAWPMNSRLNRSSHHLWTWTGRAYKMKAVQSCFACRNANTLTVISTTAAATLHPYHCFLCAHKLEMPGASLSSAPLIPTEQGIKRAVGFQFLLV